MQYVFSERELVEFLEKAIDALSLECCPACQLPLTSNDFIDTSDVEQFVKKQGGLYERN